MTSVVGLNNHPVKFTADEDDETGVRQSELVNWYLKEMEHEIESEAELVEKKNLVEKVIYKLVHMVSPSIP